MNTGLAVFILFIVFAIALGTVFTQPSTRAETVVATATNRDPDNKADGTPRFWQRDSRGGFENGGRDYCCPVAVSNSLVYLAHHGFPALLPAGEGDQPQIDLINYLTLPGYFNTDPNAGTSAGEVLTGVKRYVENHGYHCARLEYEGWAEVGHDNADAVRDPRPQLDWIEGGIRDPHGAVWLNVGWYSRSGADEWTRHGGHWVTLVGCGNDPNALLIHNPALLSPSAQPDDPANDMVHLEQVTGGKLHTWRESTENAFGMYRVSGPGLPLGRGADAAFLDAAVVFVIQP